MQKQPDGPGNFIADIIDDDIRSGKHGGRVVTRFPPEPNGYLHIGHAKSICLNFSMGAKARGGRCHLRFDDTNPETEEAHFIEAIERDVRWLGLDWGPHRYFASDYFEKLYALALGLIRDGKAYVDSQNEQQIRDSRGDFYRPGTNSPFRDRSPEESAALLEGMKRGDFDEGEHVLRAKIDMASRDLKLRDPLMYRIRKKAHHRTGTAWSIYPMYDWAHGLSDAIEGVTHSLCTLEFQNHRPLYDWFLNAAWDGDKPQQIEFARLNLTYTVLSKRKLQQLVSENLVSGWDDPRMPTLAGMRRRGYPPEAIRRFCDRIGVAKRDGYVDVTLLEHEVREQLNEKAPRYMAVLRPLRVVIENFPEGAVETFDAPLHPTDPSVGTRKVTLRRNLLVERDDFMEEPVKKWFRLAPGKEVRLRYACLITCREVVKDSQGEVVELRCTWDPDSKGGNPQDGRKVRGTLHWVAAEDAVDAEVRLYDRLFSSEVPEDAEGGFRRALNPMSEERISGAKLERALDDPIAETVQFERLGYFALDRATGGDRPVWNRTIALRDSWARMNKK